MLLTKIRKLLTILLFDLHYELWNYFLYLFSHVRNYRYHDFNCLQIIFPKTFNWPPARKWFQTIISELKNFPGFSIHEIPQKYPGLITTHVVKNNIKKEVIFDISDKPDIINFDGIDNSLLYFKMQYRKNGYDTKKVVHAQYIPGDIELYWYLSSLRKRSLKNKKIDVYGRFSTDFAQEIRGNAMKLLQTQTEFVYTGGLTTIRYSRYLREVAQSKICIDLPGNGPFCFRIIEYLAIGSCIIGPPHETLLNPPLEDGVHIKYCQSDLSDLVELCEYYLENDSERLKLVNNSRRYFDTYLRKDKLVQYYLNHILNEIS